MVTVPSVVEDHEVEQAASGPQFTVLSPDDPQDEAGEISTAEVDPEMMDDLIGEAPTEVLPESVVEPAAEVSPEPPVVEAPPVVETAEPPPAAKPKSKKEKLDQVDREIAYAEKLHEAEQEYIEACLERSRLENEIAALKKALKESAEDVDTKYDRLIHVRNKDPEQLELFDEDDEGNDDGRVWPAVPLQVDPPWADAATNEPPAAALDEPLDGSTVPMDENWWRSVPITDLDLEIKGFGKKKREALIDACPTIGALEDLRAKAGPMGMQTELPDGFGEKIASELEERVIKWLTANRDKMPIQPRTPQAEEPAADGSADGDAGHETQILARARELTVTAPDISFGAIADDGIAAARNGEPITACNWTAGDKQDSWLIGYLSVRGLSDGSQEAAGGGAEAGDTRTAESA
jgi:hypothetical protein